VPSRIPAHALRPWRTRAGPRPERPPAPGRIGAAAQAPPRGRGIRRPRQRATSAAAWAFFLRVGAVRLAMRPPPMGEARFPDEQTTPTS